MRFPLLWQPKKLSVCDMDVHKTSSFSVSCPQEASHHDEIFMQQSLLFSDTLKELKNLKKQLYATAEYFEILYNERDQKELVIETLKEYTNKAVISTVDHLGSVASKLEGVFHEKFDESSALELQLYCLQQRIKSCQNYMNQGGLSQQSLVIKTPKYHKRYIIPVEEKNGIGQSQRRGICDEYNSEQFKKAIGATTREGETALQLLRGENSAGQTPEFPSSRHGSFSSARATIDKSASEKRAGSPQRFPLLRSGSLKKRSTSPIYVTDKRRYPSEPRRSVSLVRYADRDKAKDMEQYSEKSKRLFKALLSMRKPRKDVSLYKFLDGT